MRYLAIDPGVDTGWCTFDREGRVLACGLGFPARSELECVKHAVLERPQVYRPEQSKGNPNDLITLAIQLGRYVERLSTFGIESTLVLPSRWKGQIDKDIHHARVIKTLSPDEARVLAPALANVPKSKRHNVLDAVALAKWGAQEKFWTS